MMDEQSVITQQGSRSCQNPKSSPIITYLIRMGKLEESRRPFQVSGSGTRRRVAAFSRVSPERVLAFSQR